MSSFSTRPVLRPILPADALIDILVPKIWTVQRTVKAGSPYATYFPDQASLREHFELTALKVSPLLLDLVNSKTPPIVEELEKLGLPRDLDEWGVYLLILKKKDNPTLLYTGSATSLKQGYNLKTGLRKRWASYNAKYHLPSGIKDALKKGWRITTKAAFCSCQIPPLSKVEKYRAFLILLEATFAGIFWTMRATIFNAWQLGDLLIWPIKDLPYIGINSRPAVLDIKRPPMQDKSPNARTMRQIMSRRASVRAYNRRNPEKVALWRARKLERRKNETPEERDERRAQDRIRRKKQRARETAEETEMRKARRRKTGQKYHAKKRASESEESYKTRMKRQQDWRQKRKAAETAAEKEERVVQERAERKKRSAAETQEERMKRLAYQINYYNERVKKESPKDREERLVRQKIANRIHNQKMKEKQKSETPQKRKERLEGWKAYYQKQKPKLIAKRDAESPEEREARLERARIIRRARVAAKRSLESEEEGEARRAQKRARYHTEKEEVAARAKAKRAARTPEEKEADAAKRRARRNNETAEKREARLSQVRARAQARKKEAQQKKIE